MHRAPTIEELERWRVLCAWIVLEFGARYGARALRRVERMLAAAREDDPVALAERIMNEEKERV
jgi:hypothetical protein